MAIYSRRSAPVGTQATVKTLTPAQVKELGATLVLSNTYHLYLRPGDDVISGLGGLHRFMRWPHPMLTDSGGFQVFSLAQTREIDDEGVTFKSHIDGSTHRFTPQRSIRIQENLGADIIMAFDECSDPNDHEYSRLAMERTHRWAEICLKAKRRGDQALFGIVQGGVQADFDRLPLHLSHLLIRPALPSADSRSARPNRRCTTRSISSLPFCPRTNHAT